MCYVFFFSSRRRHTRLTCDWSSDVCSSDLARGAARALAIVQRHNLPEMLARVLAGRDVAIDEVTDFLDPTIRKLMPDRSEERRVGKECRDRGSGDHAQKKIVVTVWGVRRQW